MRGTIYSSILQYSEEQSDFSYPTEFVNYNDYTINIPAPSMSCATMISRILDFPTYRNQLLTLFI